MVDIDIVVGKRPRGRPKKVKPLTTTTGAEVALIPPDPSGGSLRRDLRNLISLDILKLLTPKDIDVVVLKLVGMTDGRIVSKLSLSKTELKDILTKQEVQRALAESLWSLYSGVLTASDVAQAAEAEVMTIFYRLVMDKETDIEWRYKFGCKILDHRYQLLKIFATSPSASLGGMPLSITAEQAQVNIALESHVKERMASYLGKQDRESLGEGGSVILNQKNEVLAEAISATVETEKTGAQRNG